MTTDEAMQAVKKAVEFIPYLEARVDLSNRNPKRPDGETIEEILLVALRAIAQGGPLAVVPKEVITFLMGEGPLEGLWFGEVNPQKPRAEFWWRSHLLRGYHRKNPVKTAHVGSSALDLVRDALRAIEPGGPLVCVPREHIKQLADRDCGAHCAMTLVHEQRHSDFCNKTRAMLAEGEKP